MKKICKLLLVPLALLATTACTENYINDLDGTFDMPRYNYTEALPQATQKLGKGIKQLNVTLDGQGTSPLVLALGSREWQLQGGTYMPAASATDVNDAGLYYATIGGTPVTDGTLNIVDENGIYRINGLLSCGEGSRYVINYRGVITFEQGIDDPEPSGYVVTLNKTQATVTDMTTYQPVPLEGLSKYSFTITAPDGSSAGYIDAINATDIPLTGLAGEYTIQGSPAAAWLMDNGWVVPDWGMAGGTFFVNNGNKGYVTSGKIKLEFVDGLNGEQLVNITGNGLGAINADGSAAAAMNVSIKYAEVLMTTGTELLDLKMQSTVLGREVAYSVFLPDGFDNTKKYPVLYMLHGAGGNNNDWLQQGLVSSYAASAGKDMVVVCPQASFDGFDTFYTNDFAGKGYKYEEFFFTELVPMVEGMFSVQSDRDHRAIAGLSMGGYGALYYGMAHADMFCHIYACSPATWVDGAPSLYDIMWSEGLPSLTVEIGTSDFLYESALGFKGALEFSAIDWEFIERDGVHDWAFWTACTPKIMKKAASVFK